MVNTFYYNAERLPVSVVEDGVYKVTIYKNPIQYGDDYETLDSDFDIRDLAFPLPPIELWKRVGRSIRTSNFKMCQGGINSGFFSGDTAENASVIFLLHHIAKVRGGVHKETLIGFSLTTDLRDSREDVTMDEGTLYIDAICTNTDVRHLPVGGLRGAGRLLMDQIEQYALEPYNELDGDPYTSIKLSALPYVINYYRKLGYRHVNSCDDLMLDLERPDGQQIVEKNRDILRASDRVDQMRLRFKNDEELDYALTVELAKDKKILATGKYAEEERKDYLLGNLNEYFRPEGIIFMTHRDTKKIVAVHKETNRIHPFITGLIYTDNSSILDLLNVLRREMFAAACDEPQARHIRHNIRKDSDGDVEFHCLGEGFTMRKCLYVDVGGLGGNHLKKKRGSLKTQHSKKLHRSEMLKKKRDGVIVWRNVSPNKKERTTMKKKCGKKCFLGRGRSFPICAKNTCKISKKGVWAAFIKATRLNTRNKTYKIKGIGRRQKYSAIISKAKKNLSRKK